MTAISMFASAPKSGLTLWTSRVLSGLVMLFLAFDTALKLTHHPENVKAAAELGFTSHAMTVLGLYELACLALYLVPRTAPIAAILWTGFLGGPIAIHVRAGNPLLSHVLFPIYIAVFLWGSLWLRDDRVRALLAPRR